VGVLGWRGGALRSADRRLLEDLSHQLGGVVHSHGLVDRVREAGHRLVLAREEERRRLRHDLHDGLGPQLAGLTLQVDTLRNRLSSGVVPAGADADRELVALRTEIQSTVSEVRRIVEGLRPPALDELGLAGAVDQVVRRTARPPMTVRSHLDAPPSVPAAVEVACYRIAQEALTNVVRHSGADVATVCLRADDGGLLLEVTDDGSGTVLAREDGVGLSSMRERAEQIGGRVVIESRPGSGTSLRAWLPLEPAAAVPPTRSSSVDGATP
jgi:signal transduction histidine kinase